MTLAFAYVVLGAIYLFQFAVPLALFYFFQNWLCIKTKYLFVKLLPVAAVVTLLLVVVCGEIDFEAFFSLIHLSGAAVGVMAGCMASFGKMVINRKAQ